MIVQVAWPWPMYIVCRPTSQASVDKAIAAIAAQTGGTIDSVVDNAGRFSMGVHEGG